MKILLLISMLVFAVNLVWAQWEPDVRLTYDLDSSLTANSSWCLAAIDNFVHVVWYDNRDGNWEIYYKRSTDEGITWESDTRLTIMPEASNHPAIAASGTDVHVSWQDYRDGGSSEIYYKRSQDGGLSWGTDIRLTDDPAESYMPCVSVSGAVVNVVWTDLRDGINEIYYKRSTDGGLTWEADLRLTDDDFNSSYLPSIATFGTNVHVVWMDTRDGNGEIYYKHSTDEGASWGPDTRLTNAPFPKNFPSIVVSGTDIHVAWMDYRDSGVSEVYYKRSLDGGLSWEEDTRLTFDEWGNSWFPKLALSGPVLHVVWQDNREGNYHIYYKHSVDEGEHWGEDTMISGNGIMSSRNPSVAISGSVVHTVWYDDRDGNLEIYYKRDPTGGFPVGIDDELTGNSVQPITLYPNPACSVLNIDFNSVSDEILDMKIIDINGQTVGIYKFNSSKGLNHYKIDLNDLINGLYLIELTAGKQKYSRKILIRK